MLTVVTPFKRIENLPFLTKVLKGKCDWIVLQASDEPTIEFPEWITVKRYEITNKDNISNRLINEFISSGLDDETQYMVLCDDDSVEEGFFEKIPNKDVVCVSMKRNEASYHVVVDDWFARIAHNEKGPDILIASPNNMKIARVGGEQFIVKGKILRNYRYGLSPIGDGEMVLKIAAEHPVTYIPDAYILFNYLEDGRFKSFRRKPVVLFIGDFYCAGNKSMGISEWETNIWKSLESTELAGDVGRFHMDKHFYHYGKRGDEALLEAVENIKPDYIILILYKPLGSDPTVITEETLKELSKYRIISIWGDLEAEEQQILAKSVEKYMWKMLGTANEEIVSGLGYTYMHVPKDPRIFNNPSKQRDIDVLFNGSFGYGREERQEVLQYLLYNGIKLVAGGSEGGDHFTTEEYADRYKRAKIAISFSRARGKDVVNARPFEAMLCGALVLNQESKEMEKLYTEGYDFVSWKDKESLLKEIKILLINPDLIEGMSFNGRRSTERLYSAKTFWEKALQ